MTAQSFLKAPAIHIFYLIFLSLLASDLSGNCSTSIKNDVKCEGCQTNPIKMMDERDEVGLIMFFFVILILFLVIRIFLYCKGQRQRLSGTSQQQDRVYSISERLQPGEWSSRDAYVTVEHITAENQMNKPNYDDAPPSYEEAMRIATTIGESSTVVTACTLPKEPN